MQSRLKRTGALHSAVAAVFVRKSPASPRRQALVGKSAAAGGGPARQSELVKLIAGFEPLERA